jgi:putative DNA methylase
MNVHIQNDTSQNYYIPQEKAVNSRKKLIEVALPLEAINKASAREKSIRHGHPSTLHLWWARRPLAACRAVLFGQLVDDPSAWPDKFVGEAAQEAERQRLFRIIEQLVLWENSTNEDVLNAARWEIARSVAWGLGEQPPKQGDGKAILTYLQAKAPPVYDPFCGGGSIPLEAQRLGLRAYGSDLNPVAVLISKALVEIPPKFAGLPPVNPDARQKLKGVANWSGKGAQGLAEDVRYYGKWIRDEAEKRIGHLYPKIEITDEVIHGQPSLAPLKGRKLTVIAWLWARTVASPNPAAKGAHVPLVSSFMLSTKSGKKAWIEPVIDAAARDGYRFEVRSGTPNEQALAIATPGTKAGAGQDFICLLTGTPITRTYIQLEGKADRLGKRLMCIVAEGPAGRLYLPSNNEHELIAASADEYPIVAEARSTFLSGETPTRAMITGGVCSAYGLKTWGHLFTGRQIIVLRTLSDLVAEARKKLLAEAHIPAKAVNIEEYADAVSTYLGMNVSRQANRTATLAFWDPGGENIQQVFARQALPMVWDFCESNPLGNSSGSFTGQFDYLCKVIEAAVADSPGEIVQRDATTPVVTTERWIVSSDPPYFDNIGYADLSDFFYAWLRQSLRPIYPDQFKTVMTPKEGELVASRHRHGTMTAARDSFSRGMRAAVQNMAQSRPDFPITIWYAYKQSEGKDESISSTGWDSFLQAIFDSDLAIDGTWPIRSELTGNLKKKFNFLASSIVIVCRSRPSNAPVTSRAAFLAALKRELPAALELLQAGNIAPVDLAQASIGPGMGIFTRHSKVLEADDTPMTVKTALQLINATLDEYLFEQDADYDAETRYAITWFETYGLAAADFGDAETLAKARNVSVAGVVDAGILESRARKARLLSRSELPAAWVPSVDTHITVWECTQHIIRVLEADGEPTAAAVLAKLGSRGDAIRDLAYRLYQICERKKWTDEARAYNGLVVAWPELQRLASQQVSATSQGPAQATLI